MPKHNVTGVVVLHHPTPTSEATLELFVYPSGSYTVVFTATVDDDSTAEAESFGASPKGIRNEVRDWLNYTRAADVWAEVFTDDVFEAIVDEMAREYVS